MNKLLLAGLVGVLLPGLAIAADVTVGGAWIRATAPGQDSASIQCVITSTHNGRVVGISSPVAGSAELHHMMQMNGMMMMHATKSLPLVANKPLDLSAQGYHLMLMGLKQPLKAGEAVPFRLTLELADKRKEQIDAKAEVRPLTTAPAEHHHHHH